MLDFVSLTASARKLARLRRKFHINYSMYKTAEVMTVSNDSDMPL
jgi:hypothetical protein